MTKDEKEDKKGVLVVSELPTQQIRIGIDSKDNKEFMILTVEEALTEILTHVREIRKSVAWYTFYLNILEKR